MLITITTYEWGKGVLKCVHLVNRGWEVVNNLVISVFILNR